MTTICLIRHGETDWNAIGRMQGRRDIPLNSTGILQAEECGQYLKSSLWDLIITSPLKRARLTAEIINRTLNVPLVVMDELKEKSFGDAEGMTFQERKTAFPDNNFPNQEDGLELTKRVMGGLDSINQKYGDSRLLLVAHGAVIHSILTFVSNGEFGLGNINLKNACFNDIHFHQEQWKIKTVNQVAHLSSDK
ncbi:MAG: histidine phosphatase family protein [Bacillus sp. (in: Bacteria)]|nr:histidine phosphatase family protein [Bacillus sp. (in: firmicutes)]